MQKLDYIQAKIHSSETLGRQLACWRLFSEKIVFTNGCFDILHLGHVDYLSKAADLGTKLIVGVNTDSSVKRLNKGPSRPIQHENARAVLLAALHFVDAVIIFEEDTPLEIISFIKPDVLVKGGDWKIENIVGHHIVKEKGGHVQTIDFLPGYSTTSIENKIKSS